MSVGTIVLNAYMPDDFGNTYIPYVKTCVDDFGNQRGYFVFAAMNFDSRYYSIAGEELRQM